MVVDHASRLHEGITDGWPHEPKAAPGQVLAHCLRLCRFSRYLVKGAPCILPHLTANKLPEIGVETTYLFPKPQKGTRVINKRLDFHPVAHYSTISLQLYQLAIFISSNLLGVKIIKCLPICLTLFEDRDPAQASLSTF